MELFLYAEVYSFFLAFFVFFLRVLFLYLWQLGFFEIRKISCEML